MSNSTKHTQFYNYLDLWGFFFLFFNKKTKSYSYVLKPIKMISTLFAHLWSFLIYSTDQTQPKTKADFNGWPRVCFVSDWCLHLKLCLLWAWYVSARGQLRVYVESAFCTEMWSRRVPLLTVCKPATCIFQRQMQRRLANLQYQFKDLLLRSGSAFCVCSRSTLGQ